MEVDIEEDENEPELTYPYEEGAYGCILGTLFRSVQGAYGCILGTLFCSVQRDVTKDKTVPTSVHEVVGWLLFQDDCVVARFVKKKGKSKDEYYGKLILDLGNEVRSSVEQGTIAMEKLVEKLGNAEEKVECKKLKKELEEARFSNTFLHMQNERVERDIYWTRVRAHEFYREMIRRGFMFEERPNEVIEVPVKDKKSPSSEPRGSPHDA
ncbi:hypothetical protein Tco_0621068 [Tanacetum coccineum]